MKNQFNKYDKIAIFSISIGFLLAVSLPYLFTNFASGINFGTGEKNPIGDTIGGISGPIIGLVSSILVYLTLKEQIIANQRILDQFELNENDKKETIYFNFLNKELDELISFLNSYKEENENLFDSGEIPFFDFPRILNDFFLGENSKRSSSRAESLEEDSAIYRAQK